MTDTSANTELEVVQLGQFARQHDLSNTEASALLARAGFPGKVHNSRLSSDQQLAALAVLSNERRSESAVDAGEVIRSMHALSGFTDAGPLTPASHVAAELGISLALVFELAGSSIPGGPNDPVSADLIRQSYMARRSMVAETEVPDGVGAGLMTYSPRHAMVAGVQDGQRLTPRDWEINNHLYRVVANVFAHWHRRDFDACIPVTDDKGNVVRYRVPSLVNPGQFFTMKPDEYLPVFNDPTTILPYMDQAELYTLRAEMSELTYIPDVCVNCQDPTGFHTGLENKIWLLIQGHRTKGIRFWLPGMKDQWTELHRQYQLPTDSAHFQRLGFRRSHDECAIIVYEIQSAMQDFPGTNWYVRDEALLEAFFANINDRLIGRLPEIGEKTRGAVDRTIVEYRAQACFKVLFDGIDQARANREAGLSSMSVPTPIGR